MTDIDKERELRNLYLSSMLIVFPAGFGTYVLTNNMLAAISAVFVSGAFLVFLKTILTIKVAELEVRLVQVKEGE